MWCKPFPGKVGGDVVNVTVIKQRERTALSGAEPSVDCLPTLSDLKSGSVAQSTADSVDNEIQRNL